jgi:hypothetical protein
MLAAMKTTMAYPDPTRRGSDLGQFDYSTAWGCVNENPARFYFLPPAG